MFLTPAEVHELTGCVQPAAQRRWLTRNGIQFFVRADGRPSVPKEQITPMRPTGPDLTALAAIR